MRILMGKMTLQCLFFEKIDLRHAYFFQFYLSHDYKIHAYKKHVFIKKLVLDEKKHTYDRFLQFYKVNYAYFLDILPRHAYFFLKSNLVPCLVHAYFYLKSNIAMLIFGIEKINRFYFFQSKKGIFHALKPK